MRKIRVSLLLFFTSFCLAEEIRLFRLSDKVGDTIDFAEREQYSLFPGIINFESARILVRDDTGYFAEIYSRDGDILSQFLLKLTPKEVERLTFFIENYDTIKTQIANDEYVELAFKRFWDRVESNRISTIDEEISPSTIEGRFIWTVRGTTIGSAAGGCAGSWLGVERVSLGGYQESGLPPTVPPGACVLPSYRVDHTVFWSATCLGIGAGAIGGYKLGERIDRTRRPAVVGIKEGKGWRLRLAIAFAVPALTLGKAISILAGGTLFGKKDFLGIIVNDPHDLTFIPALITGIGVTIEIIHLGYRIGRSIDRKHALRAARESSIQNNEGVKIEKGKKEK